MRCADSGEAETFPSTFSVGAYVVVSIGPWYGHYGQIQRVYRDDRNTLHMVDRDKNFLHCPENKLRRLSVRIAASRLFLLCAGSLPPSGGASEAPSKNQNDSENLDDKLKQLGDHALYLQSRRAVIEKGIKDGCWSECEDESAVVESILEHLIQKLEQEEDGDGLSTSIPYSLSDIN